ncbi:Amino acid transporter transmembrane [Lasiodiplodia theobromae]|uniref:N amino acid transport system protein n=1 Tax=Lasiodiplodia theobromae TaxID=45133 RepID=A0A5N5CUQ6_9PEZI|nr:Amino acid transporter [Lasiodiplodia theobromae]KAB2569077.1 N amino acid transport system protein [Lasiodiplodia theobromae]KAF4544893.1 Amino acid transporter [Lasiodiplodia theobromae]KAF9637737.1 Amino acid transporter transmembrane [Lasiodiplodia theobromae]
MTGQDFTTAPPVHHDDNLETKKRLSSQNDEEGYAKELQQQPLDPYGDEVGAAVQYKTMKWWQGAIVMIAENISLGILSLPAVIAKVGLIGGLIAIVGLGIFTTYSGYLLWQFRMRYPQCTNMGDVGEVLFGRFGREFFGAFYVLYCIFSAASHLLTFVIAMNVLTGHATCSIVWGIVGLVIFSILTIPRTLKNVSFLSIISFLSILSAVLLTIIALGVAPKASYSEMDGVYHPSFPSAFNSISNAVFAYGGHVAWLSFISEFRNPEEFPKALYTLQSIDTTLYVIAALTIYRYAGEDVPSPALSANSAVVSKVAWGIAMPTIVIAGVIFAHVTAKYVYLRMFAGTKYLHSRGVVATGSWIGLGVGTWTISWIIASSIPNFSDLLGFVSALCASWFSYGIPGFLWFHLNKGRWFNGPKQILCAFSSFCLIVIAIIIFGVGLYASGYQMSIDSSGASWSCADNSK